MKILDSPLLGQFIAYLKATWSSTSRVDQRRRRLRQLVIKVRAVTDAAESRGHSAVRSGSLDAWLRMLREEALRGQRVLDASRCDAAAVASSTRRFLAGIRGLVACSDDVNRLAEAVEELERLAGPGGDLDLFVKVLRLDDARVRATTAMDVDGPPVDAARHGPEEEATGSSNSAESVSAGVKRKRAVCSSGGGSTTPEPDAADHRKRRVLAWARPHIRRPLRRDQEVGASPSHRCAWTVALAMARVRRGIGKNIGQQLSRLSL